MKNIILAILLTITLTSFAIAADDGVGMGDSVYNSIVRAENITNSSNTTIPQNYNASIVISNITYKLVTDGQQDRIEAKVGNVSEVVNNYVTSSNQTLTIIQMKADDTNLTVSNIRDNPTNTDSGTASILILIFGILILGAAGFLIYLVMKKKETILYRCDQCQKLYVQDGNQQDGERVF